MTSMFGDQISHFINFRSNDYLGETYLTGFWTAMHSRDQQTLSAYICGPFQKSASWNYKLYIVMLHKHVWH